MSNDVKGAIKYGGGNQAQKESEEMEICKNKHKGLFQKVMGELHKIFYKKSKVVEDYFNEKDERKSKNQDSSLAIQAQESKQAENFPSKTENKTPVKKGFADESCTLG